jgi:hypothetical protein
MADLNANGIISHSELLDYTRQKTEEYCQSLPACQVIGFTPELQSSNDVLGDPFVPIEADEVSLSEDPSDLFVGKNSANLDLEILPSKTVRIGQPIRMRIRSKRPGQLIILDINAKGEILQIFPNRIADEHGQNSRLNAGEVLTIPDAYYGFEFVAGEPTGSGRLVAILIEDPVNVDDIVSIHNDLSPIVAPRDYLISLAARLRQTWTQDEINRPLVWSVTELPYEIIR